MRQLTEHQLRLLTLAASGMTHPEIAQVFGIDHKSVRYQLRRVRLKLGAKNTTHAVYIAFLRQITPGRGRQSDAHRGDSGQSKGTDVEQVAKQRANRGGQHEGRDGP